MACYGCRRLGEASVARQTFRRRSEQDLVPSSKQRRSNTLRQVGCKRRDKQARFYACTAVLTLNRTAGSRVSEATTKHSNHCIDLEQQKRHVRTQPRL